MPHRAVPLTDAYAACERMARQHYENFPVASYLLPAAMRPHIAAVYAFARVADDIADEGAADPGSRQAQLAQWLARLHVAAGLGDRDAGEAAARATGTPDSVAPENVAPENVAPENVAPENVAPESDDRDERILMAVGHSIRALDLPIAWFDDLVSAFGQDIMTTRYASWRDVCDYCRRSANPVGRLVLRIAGYREAALDRSSDALCTALQLTNFWQDFGRDWRIGRLYVPAETMRASGASEETLGGARLTEAWANAITACAAFTRERFAAGRLVCDGVRGRLRAELRLTWLGGMRILERVEQGRYDLMHRRPVLGFGDAPALIWRAMTWPGSRPPD